MAENFTDEEIISNLEKRSKNILLYGIIFLVASVLITVFIPPAVIKWS